MSNLGPLTTTFTPDGRVCFETFMGINADISWLQYGHQTTCMPPNFKRELSYYFSPGLCPQGRNYGCLTDVGNGVTEATCCPSPYTCITNRPHEQIFGCQYVITTSTWISIAISSYEPLPAESLPSLTGISLGYGTPINAFAPIVRRSAGDPEWAANLIVTPTTGSLEPSGTGGDSLPSGTDSGLSTGAAVGVGIGATLGAVVIIGAAVAGLLIARRRRRKRLEPAIEPYNHGMNVPSPQHTELSSHREPSQLDGRQKPAELPVQTLR